MEQMKTRNKNDIINGTLEYINNLEDQKRGFKHLLRNFRKKRVNEGEFKKFIDAVKSKYKDNNTFKTNLTKAALTLYEEGKDR